MVLPQGLGHEARKADWREEGKGSRRPEDRRNPALHLGRRHLVRLGAGDGGIILFSKLLVRPRRTGDVPLGRWS